MIVSFFHRTGLVTETTFSSLPFCLKLVTAQTPSIGLSGLTRFCQAPQDSKAPTPIIHENRTHFRPKTHGRHRAYCGGGAKTFGSVGLLKIKTLSSCCM